MKRSVVSALLIVGGAGCSSPATAPSPPVVSTGSGAPAAIAPAPETGPAVADVEATGNQLGLTAAVFRHDAEGVIQVIVTATPPYHVNAEYPHRLVLEGDGLTDDVFTDAGAFVVDGPIKGHWRRRFPWPAGADSFTVAGRFFTSVCSDEKCIIEKVPLTLTVGP